MQVQADGVPRLTSYAEAKAWYEAQKPWRKREEYGEHRPLSASHRAKHHLSISYDQVRRAYRVWLYDTAIVTFFLDGTIKMGVYNHNTQSTRAILDALRPITLFRWVSGGLMDTRTQLIADTREITITPSRRVEFTAYFWPSAYKTEMKVSHPRYKYVRSMWDKYHAVAAMGGNIADLQTDELSILLLDTFHSTRHDCRIKSHLRLIAASVEGVPITFDEELWLSSTKVSRNEKTRDQQIYLIHNQLKARSRLPAPDTTSIALTYELE